MEILGTLLIFLLGMFFVYTLLMFIVHMPFFGLSLLIGLIVVALLATTASAPKLRGKRVRTDNQNH